MNIVNEKGFDVYQVSKDLVGASLPRYKKDNRICSWPTIGQTPDLVRMYLPKKAIELLAEEPIIIRKNLFAIYTDTHLPDFDGDTRTISFPSLLPKEEFRRDLMFYIGMILSSYKKDSENEIQNEYDDVLPFLLDYLYLKEVDREDSFSLKHLNILKKQGKVFNSFFDGYQKLKALKDNPKYCSLSDEQRDKFVLTCIERKNELDAITEDTVPFFSSLDGALEIIDMAKSKEEIKSIIEQLILNEKENRKAVLEDLGIKPIGYKRLIKEIDSKKKK